MNNDANQKNNILYLDCSMGSRSEMLVPALYELLDEVERKSFIKQMDALVPGEVSVLVKPDEKCGILGTRFDVLVSSEEECSGDGHEHSHEHSHEHVHHHEHEHAHGHHGHHSMADVTNIIEGFSGISDNVKDMAIDVYKILADAESAVHRVPVSEIHFHEVGMMDAIFNITAVCLLIDTLKVDKVYASPVRTGKGQIKCAHGILPVPAPATANILIGIPTYAGDIDAEFCTPTGAALLKYFVSDFREQPAMTVRKIGYGMGNKNFDACNCVRALFGSAAI